MAVPGRLRQSSRLRFRKGAQRVEQKRARLAQTVTRPNLAEQAPERHAFRASATGRSEVTSAACWRSSTPICFVKAQTAPNVRQRGDWSGSIAMNLRPDNPCDRLGPVLCKQYEVVRHMRVLPHRGMAATVATVRGRGDVCGARWDEMDTEAHVWTVSAGTMKASRKHRVPLRRSVPAPGRGGDLGTVCDDDGPSRYAPVGLHEAAATASLARGQLGWRQSWPARTTNGCRLRICGGLRTTAMVP